MPFKKLNEKDLKDIFDSCHIRPIKKISFNERRKLAIKKWKDNNLEKIEAHKQVYIALRSKVLKKKLCFCGKRKVEAHHNDYSKPLEVEWFCKKHHVNKHKKLRET